MISGNQLNLCLSEPTTMCFYLEKKIVFRSAYKIDFKIVLRDSNLEFMDLHLTNGGREIPKLIVFDKNDKEFFQWGSKPIETQNLFTRLMNSGMEKSKISGMEEAETKKREKKLLILQTTQQTFDYRES